MTIAHKHQMKHWTHANFYRCITLKHFVTNVYWKEMLPIVFAVKGRKSTPWTTQTRQLKERHFDAEQHEFAPISAHFSRYSWSHLRLNSYISWSRWQFVAELSSLSEWCRSHLFVIDNIEWVAALLCSPCRFTLQWPFTIISSK